MKILFITPFFYPHKGGGEVYAEELLSTLVQHHPKMEVDILCYNTENKAPYEQRLGLTIHRVECFSVPVDPFTLPNPIPLIKKLYSLRHRNYHFVFTQTRFFDATWWTWLYARLIGAKSIFIGHGTGFTTYQSWLVRGVARLVDLTLARLSLQFYDQVVVISQATGDFYQRYLGVKKPVLIYGGVNVRRIARSRRTASRIVPGINRKIPQGATVITYVGRLTWAKGVTFLYRAFRQIASKKPDSKLYLVIAGGGPLEKDLQSRVKKDGLSDRVFLTGSLELTQVYKLLSLTDIFVNPSCNEGLPRTVMEAAVAGCLVIATDVGATGEIIENQRSGLLITPQSVTAITSALMYVLNNRQAVKAMTKRAKKDVQERFDWGVVSERFYTQVLVG